MQKTRLVVSSFFFVFSLYASASDQNRNSLDSLPPAAQSSISAALGRDIPEYSVQVSGRRVQATNTHHQLEMQFTSTGVGVGRGDSRWGLALQGYGYGNDLRLVRPADPQARANRVEYQRESLTEWYVNGPIGLEQGFTIDKAPGKPEGKPLTIAVSLTGDLKAAVDESRTSLSLTARNHSPELRYAGLSATDATGKQLQAWLELEGATLLLRVDDRNGLYPIVVDPVIQLAKLTPSNGTAFGLFGAAAVSGDTAVVGANSSSTGQGIIYVFVKPASGWTNMTETAQLTTSVPPNCCTFGDFVAISGDTVIAGSLGDGANQGGVVYVYVKPSGGWTNMTETATLSASDGYFGEGFGFSVAIDGNTVAVGAISCSGSGNFANGEAYVFVKPASGWTNMTETGILSDSDGLGCDYYGYSVGVSGNTVAVGKPNDGFNPPNGFGSAYVFVEPAGGWANMAQTAELTTSDRVVGDGLGTAVAVSGDTVVVGAPAARNSSQQDAGGAYVYVKPATGWVNMSQTAKLTNTHGTTHGSFASKLAIKRNIIVVGDPANSNSPGAVYLFVKPVSGWKNAARPNARLVANDGQNGDAFGQPVSISGKTIVAGALCATVSGNSCEGAAYVFGSQ
jgi:hypothetical protein